MSLRSATSAAACWIALPIFSSEGRNHHGKLYVLESDPIDASEAGNHVHTKSISHIHSGSCALQNTECPDDGRGHAILGLVDAEVLERSLGLRSPILVGGNLDLAKGIALGSRVGSHSQGCGVEVSLDL